MTRKMVVCRLQCYFGTKRNSKKRKGIIFKETEPSNMLSNNSIVRGLEFSFFILSANINRDQYLVHRLLKRDVI